MHVKDQRVFYLVDQLKDYIDQCDAFATEIELQGIQPNPQDFLIPNGQLLHHFLDYKKFSKWKKIMEKAFDLNLDHFVQQMPLLTISMISETMMAAEKEVPLDKFLSEYASSKEKTLLGVENFQEHMNVLQRIPIEFQVKALGAVLRNVSNYRKSIKLMTAYYLRQDIFKLYKAAKQSLQDSRKVMLYERNFKMADSINDMMKDHSVFVAVGAGHLAGKYGLIKLLKDKGYRLKPVQIR